MVQLARFKGKKDPFFLHLCSLFYLSTVTMPPVRCKRPATRRPNPSPISPGLESAPVSATLPNNNLFQEFIGTCSDRVQDQAAAAPAVKARKKTSDKLFKASNPDLYYDPLHIECYYFCEQYKDNFETTGAKGYKHIRLTAFFLKD